MYVGIELYIHVCMCPVCTCVDIKVYYMCVDIELYNNYKIGFIYRNGTDV